MGLKQEDAVVDVKNMIVELNKLKPEYVPLVLQGKDVDASSYNTVMRMRKLAQNYLHEAIVIEKDEITEEMDKLNNVIDRCESYTDIEPVLELLKQNKFTEADTLTNYRHPLSNLTSNIMSVLRTVKELQREEKITGDIQIDTSNLVAKPVKNEALNSYKRKLELVEKSQELDRTLQGFMNKIATCTVPDSSYELQKKRIKAKIKELEQQTL